MSVLQDAASEIDSPTRRSTFRLALTLLRISVSMQALATLWQPIVIGRYLDGNYAALELHTIGAVAVQITALLTTLLAVWFGLLIRRGGLVVLQIFLLFLLVGLQAGFGYTRTLGGHVPVGVAVVGLTMLLLWWVYARAGRAVPRRRRRDSRPAGGGSKADS